MSSAPSVPLLQQTSPNLATELRRYLEQHRVEVEAMVRTGSAEAGLPAGRRAAKNFDGLLSALFHAVYATFRGKRGWVPVSLAAVGSYGRGVVALRSDLDVRLLCPNKPAKAAPIAEALLYPLWDIGLSIGHQVVGIGDMVDLARRDLATATTLLDWRLIAGDESSSDKLLGRAFEGVFGAATIGRFLEELGRQSIDRHDRFGDSVYLLEPDVKNGLGGLRDLDVAHWAARARWRVKDLRELVQVGVLVPREYQQIEAAAALLWRVRNLLHLYSGRRADRLSFDRQEALARDLGYGTGGAGVEHFMSEYYRQARQLSQAREMLLARAAPPPKRRPRERLIGDGLKLTNEQVSLSDPALLEQEPALALRLFDEAVRRDLPVYPFARDAVARAANSPSWCERLRKEPEAAKLFTRLAKVVQRTKLREGSPLKQLHEVGLLVAMIPEFAPVVGRVHHDLYHVYTVDVHSVAAVDRLRELCRGELAVGHPLASRLAAEIARPNVIFLATLLHDIGKDIGGRDHSRRGAEMAEQILKRLGLAESDIVEVQHLVLKHLRMYHVATRRDIDDPTTLKSFCREVQGREGLRELYLLTIVDVSTTSPNALTNWKARMLEDLYVSANRALGTGEFGPSETRAEGIRAAVRVEVGKTLPAQFVDHFLRAVPERYLYANEPTEIVAHCHTAYAALGVAFRVEVIGVDEPYVELAFVADDRPGLLAQITASLAVSRVKVVGAQIYSWKDPQGRLRALDLFWVRLGARAETLKAALPRIERDFARLLSGEISAPDLVLGGGRPSSWSNRPAPKVPTQVSLDNRAATDDTVLEVITRDQIGLLFWLSHAIQALDLSISLAKINTEGNQVADVFYVKDANGAKLSSPERIEELKERIMSAIAQLEVAAS
ncbi:MAG TPA: [protein-PII] uridylyltransferase [Polyangiaceae bacterium]|jgi:[protein-PII] uridylyltransferase